MKSVVTRMLVGIVLVLVVVLSLATVVLSRSFERRLVDAEERHAAAYAEMLVASVDFALTSGVADTTRLVEHLESLESVDKFRVVPAEGFPGADEVVPDGPEQRALKQGAGTDYRSLSEVDGGRVFRLTRPIIATSGCADCSTPIKAQDIIGAVTIVLSGRVDSRLLHGYLLAIIAVMVVSALVVVSGAALFVRRIVGTPISSLRDLVKDIAEGEADLTKRLNLTGSDEIAEASMWLDAFLDLMHSIVSGIKDTSEENEGISHQLDTGSQHNLSSSRTIKENISAIEDRLEQLTGTNRTTAQSVAHILATITGLADQIRDQSSAVQQTSASIEEMASSIASVSSISQSNAQAVEHLLSLTQDGDEKVRTTNERIREISRAVDDLLELISIINAIATQTNLLSMNAAIEAAHAGEFGKGFAVVADEIKRLSVSTAENATRITGMLETIIDQIQDSLDSSSQSGEAFSNIQESVRDVVQSFTEINNSTTELDVGSSEILTASSNLLEITETIRTQADAIRDGAGEIHQTAEDVTGISQDVLDRVKRINEEANQIIEQSEQIAELGARNARNSEVLNEDMSLFKT